MPSRNVHCAGRRQEERCGLRVFIQEAAVVLVFYLEVTAGTEERPGLGSVCMDGSYLDRAVASSGPAILF